MDVDFASNGGLEPYRLTSSRLARYVWVVADTADIYVLPSCT